IQPRWPPPADRPGDRGARAAVLQAVAPGVDAAGIWVGAQRTRARRTPPRRILRGSPDVTVSTNLGAWVNRRGLFARAEKADLFRSEKIPSTFNWDFSPKGQHLELGIAESNLFIMLSALGLSHHINGERLLPVGMLFDPFIERGLDALNYACYQDARFMVAAT